MSKSFFFYFGLLAVAFLGGLTFAFSKQGDPNHAQAMLLTPVPAQSSLYVQNEEIPPAASNQPATTAAGDGGEAASSDGKEVMAPDGKEVLAPDGKEILGKEVLPPVAELITPQTSQVFFRLDDPANELLNNPNHSNTHGPVVSPDTSTIPPVEVSE